MGVRERKVEDYLKDQVRKHLTKGLCEKWGTEGNPDRVVLYNKKSYYLEIKTCDGSEQSNQSRKIERIRDTGNHVYTLKGHDGVDWFINMVREINVNPSTT